MPGTFLRDAPLLNVITGSTHMVKKLRFQEHRPDPRRRKRQPRERWVFEPLDAALLAVIVAVLLWLQWLLAQSPA